jgi:hypothetical protein
MSRTRRTFGKDSKAKVVLEALKEKDTIEVLAKVRAVAQSNFNVEVQRYGIFLQFFCRKKIVTKMKSNRETLRSNRSADFWRMTLKKSLG